MSEAVQHTLPVEAIKIGDRHRKDLGDLSELAESIRDSGLLHPIVVTPDQVLIAGERRLRACQKIGMREVPVTVAWNITDARALLVAERDENTCRKDMSISEKVALGKALEEMERPKAEARMKAGAAPCENFAQGSTGKTSDIVGAAVGMSRPTYERAKVVVEAAEDSTLPPEAQAVAREALDEMDRTGKVLGPHDRVAPLVGLRAAKGGTERNGKGRRTDKLSGYDPDTERKRGLAEGQKKRLVTALSAMSGFCRGIEDLDIGMAVSVCTAEEVAQWAAMAGDCARTLRSLRDNLNRSNGDGQRSTN